MKQFEVKKLYKIKIQIPEVNSLDDYYKLKGIYDESIQKNKKRNCPNCKESIYALAFGVKDRNLFSICPTPKCKSNMVIPIEMCKMYDDFYQDSKKMYENTVDTILSTKFDILFGYTNESESNIAQLKENYHSTHDHYMQCIDDYKDIVYIKSQELKGFEQRRDDLIEQLKNPDADVKKIYKELQPILCEIRKLNYTTLPNSTIIRMPYSFDDLQSCGPIATSILLTEQEKKKLTVKRKEKEKEKEKEKKSKKIEECKLLKIEIKDDKQ